MHEEWAARFWARVDKSAPDNGCWLWTGSRLPAGYGRFCPRNHIRLNAHRVSWEIANQRAVPAGLLVLHRCDNPPCVRPDHLFVGTHADNVQDMLAKGRAGDTGMPGESHPQHKLSAEDVVAIRARWEAGGTRQRELAAEYGVSRGLIGHIVRRVVWRHV